MPRAYEIRKCSESVSPAVAGNLCGTHELVGEKLKRCYPLWQMAYDGINYEDYLKSLIGLLVTGHYVVVLAKLVLRNRGGNTE